MTALNGYSNPLAPNPTEPIWYRVEANHSFTHGGYEIYNEIDRTIAVSIRIVKTANILEKIEIIASVPSEQRANLNRIKYRLFPKDTQRIYIDEFSAPPNTKTLVTHIISFADNLETYREALRKKLSS